MANDYKAVFLGPRAENAGAMEQLLLDVLRDHAYWRANFHPEDPRLIREEERLETAFAQKHAHLRDALFEVLAQLKRAAPLHSPRQLAHIVSDPSIPALLGYFAGMLYNQNNVVQEVSPETVRRERDYIDALAKMVGYPRLPSKADQPKEGQADEPRSWGHLCSGGTTANIEALWVARNLKFYPLALRLAAQQNRGFHDDLRALKVLVGGAEAELSDLSTWDLLNLSSENVLRLYRGAKEYLERQEGDPTKRRQLSKELQKATVNHLGLANFTRSYNDRFRNDPLEKLPLVFISVTAHYCWKKGMDLVGLGSASLVPIGTDDFIRLAVPDLRERLARAAKDRQPVLMVASICGTTEEAAVDPLHEVSLLREEDVLPGFWHHCDAALGGYLATLLLRDEAGSPRSFEDQGDDLPVTTEVYKAIAALESTDSMALDPHKLGYVPYPCGAVLFRDHRPRDVIAYEAPYLAGGEHRGFGGFLGQYTLEGSRPGAAAVSCYLSQVVLPLDRTGHGEVVARCIRATERVFDGLQQKFEGSELSFRPFNLRPDAMGFCFLLLPAREALDLAELNTLTKRIWETMTVLDDRLDAASYAFLLSKSEVKVGQYREVLSRMFKGSSSAASLEEALQGVVPGYDDGPELCLLRVFVLNPFVSEWIEETAKLGGTKPLDVLFSEHVYKTSHRLLPEFVLERFGERFIEQGQSPRRLRVLVLEDSREHAEPITSTILFDKVFSRFLEMKAVISLDELRKHVAQDGPPWDKFVLDLQLEPNLKGLDGVLAARFLLEQGVKPNKLVIFSRFSSHPEVREELLALGLEEDQILEKDAAGWERTDGAERLPGLQRLLDRLVVDVLESADG